MACEGLRRDTYGAEPPSSPAGTSPEQDPQTGGDESQTHPVADSSAGHPGLHGSAEHGDLPSSHADALDLGPEVQFETMLGSEVAETGQPNATIIFPAPPTAIAAGPEMCQVCDDATLPTVATARCLWETASTGRHCGCTVHHTFHYKSWAVLQLHAARL